ncbi:unnamed protein product [Cuscuta europaea]|uniref:Uncharacterized protein n=1 Tax=Cuscuta europaea TaxID=41803 RepID=A0A9P1EK66_CUSEU|nr:unnamed protein product [Cuscuta europaea]
MSTVYSFFLQEESQRTLQHPINSVPFPSDNPNNHDPPSVDSVAFLVKKSKKKYITCTHCAYQDHYVDKCFQVIEYPPNWKGPKGLRIAHGFKLPANSTKNTHAHLANTSTDSSSNDLDFCDPNLYNKFLEFMKTQTINLLLLMLSWLSHHIISFLMLLL